MIPAARSLAAALLSAALLAGCGGDEESSDPAPRPAETTAAAGGAFDVEDVSFTFSYPEDLELVEDDEDKQKALLTPDPNDIKSGIKISVVSDQPLGYEEYIDTFEKQFEDDLGTKVEQRRETLGAGEGRPVGILEWTDDYTYEDLGQETTTELKSTSYFFMDGGKAWQIECLSDPERRDLIESACAEILETLDSKE